MVTEEELKTVMLDILGHAENALAAASFTPMLLLKVAAGTLTIPIFLLPMGPAWTAAIDLAVKAHNPEAVILIYTSYCWRSTIKAKPLDLNYEKIKNAVENLASTTRHNTLIVYGKTPLAESSVVREYKIKKDKIIWGTKHTDDALLVSCFFEGIFETPRDIQ